MSASRTRMIEEVRVASWTQLMDELYFGSWAAGIKRHRSPYVFRGQCDRNWDLSTSLIRLGGGRGLGRLEGHLLRNFRKYARSNVTGVQNLWDWLSLAQHHGLPTRLLDWTFSPYVALHFATVDLRWKDSDAMLWCVNHCAVHQHLPAKLRKALDQEGSDVFTVDLLDQTAPSLKQLEDLSEHDFALFLEPPSLDARIVNQFALFSLMSQPAARLDFWLEKHPKLVRKVVIPADLKLEVRDKLDQANITERMLFPGLDGLSQWLSRYYQPQQHTMSTEEAEQDSAEQEQRFRRQRLR